MMYTRYMMNISEIVSHILATSSQTLVVFVYALLGGFVPALFWLWFWLHERQSHNEPRRVIAKVFLLGMFGVFVSIFIQRFILEFFSYKIPDLYDASLGYNVHYNKTVLLIHVIVEEMVKFGAAYVVAFKTNIFDEPIDAFVYLMTAALGFAAMENTLYLIQPLLAGETVASIVTGYMRFIGSNILHVTASGALSVCIGLSFCKSYWIRELWVWIGLGIACLLHWLFNMFMVIQNGSSAFLVFSSTWMVAIGLILMLEKVKQNKCSI